MSALSTEKDLFDELTARFASAVERMATEKPVCSWDPLPSAPGGNALRWHQPFKSLEGSVRVVAAEADWIAAGRAVLLAAGIEQADPMEYRSAFLEIVHQGMSGFGQALSRVLKRDVVPEGGAESPEVAAAKWAEIHVKVGGISFSLAVGLDDALQTALAVPPQSPHPGTVVAAGPGPSPSKTFDLLLDVELPVSVSFGRAQIPLKDVLKLTTGSIVELNRSIIEPVEIIVNNCVIARGEVVVVDGNFGVRVQAVISRQERLRTLQ